MFHVYTITNALTGHAYIGQTRNGHERWQQHLYYLRRGTHFNQRLQRAFTKYMEAAFMFALVAEYQTTEECCIAESKAIADALAAGLCYNLKSQVTVYGGLMSADVRQRMSIAHTGAGNYQFGRRGEASANFGKKHSMEMRHQLSAARMGEGNPMWGKPSPMLGRHLSEEAKAKVSAAHKGRNNRSPEQCAAHSARMTGAGNPFYGHKHSPESLEKMRAARKIQPHPMKGKTHSAEARRNMSEAARARPSRPTGRPSPMRGRTMSAEVRAKMSVGMRASWARRKAQQD